MHKPKQQPLINQQPHMRRQLEYVPLTFEIIDAYSRSVCRKLGELDPNAKPDTETIRGFANFIRAVATIQVHYLNKGVSHVEAKS